MDGMSAERTQPPASPGGTTPRAPRGSPGGTTPRTPRGSPGEATPRTPRGILPFVAAQPLVDHHCHGVLRAGGDLAGLLNEADGDATADGMPLDSLAGLA